MFLDPLYILLIVVGGLLSFGASLLVKSRFERGRRTGLWNGITGAEVARRVLASSGIDDVQVVEHPGFLSDHYNPLTKTLALSPDVYHGIHAAAAGVAAHEAGHAIQHAQGYVPMWLRSLLVPAANFGSMLGPWIIIAGMMLGAAQGAGLGSLVATVGVALFGMATLFTVITVPVEYDASARAKLCLDRLGIVRSTEERDAVAGVLNAAGLTYVAAAASSIMMLLYWAMKAGLLGRRDD